MRNDFGYPLGDPEDTELRHDTSISSDFHKDRYSETDLREHHFEVNAPDFVFRPMYYPDRVIVSKERDLVREKGICRNEYVKDVGTENREVHVVGFVTAYRDSTISDPNYVNNLQSFHDLCDFGQRADIVTMQWAGEVLLQGADLEGPEGVDPETGHFLYEYTLDFVSTGYSEMGVATTGIIDDGVDPDIEDFL